MVAHPVRPTKPRRPPRRATASSTSPSRASEDALHRCATFVRQAITSVGEFKSENTTTGQAILKSPLAKSASILPLSFS